MGSGWDGLGVSRFAVGSSKAWSSGGGDGKGGSPSSRRAVVKRWGDRESVSKKFPADRGGDAVKFWSGQAGWWLPADGAGEPPRLEGWFVAKGEAVGIVAVGGMFGGVGLRVGSEVGG